MKHKYLCIATTFFIIGAMLFACGTGSVFNTENYPDSIIIGAFGAAGVNPEAFSRRALNAIRVEIQYGRFTRDDVIDFTETQMRLLSNGMLSYVLIGQVIERYGRDFLLADDVSEVAALAYVMLMPELEAFNVESPIGPQDVEVTMEFLKFIHDGV